MVLRGTMKLCLLLTLAMLSMTRALLVATTEASNEGKPVVVGPNEEGISGSKIPEIYEMYIKSNVTNRYAITSVTSKVKNVASKAREAVFLVVLPEHAFLSEFVMEIGGKSYKANIKEKEDAKNIYNKAVNSGQSAIHVETRDSIEFTVSLHIQPESEVVFKLTYEELLKRRDGKYELVLNIVPGKIVPELEVEVEIHEATHLNFVGTPSLRSGNGIEKIRDQLKPNTEITIIYPTSLVVKFNPDKEEQRKFAKALHGEEKDGLKGQFVVQYDVKRNGIGGEVLQNDGYFVHFFAPESLENLPKQIVFVLDVSGSMWGEKMHQLINAMVHILDELKPHDSFSIITFDTTVNVWDIESGWIDLKLDDDTLYDQLEVILEQKKIPPSVIATPENIARVKTFASTIKPRSLTNFIGGLEVGLFIIKKEQQKSSEFRQPLMVFLTDGEANVGISDGDAILEKVAKLNPKEKQTPIFSLSFGKGVDNDFVRKLSSQNSGFAKHIYLASDASVQLQAFYHLISSPIIKEVAFKYTKDATFATKNHFPVFFRGSEIVVAGKIPKEPKNEFNVEGWRPGGKIVMKPEVIETTQSLERLWAFLSLQQIFRERHVIDDKTELTKKAIDLALKYAFVTPVTSFDVATPNATDEVKTHIVKSHSGHVGHGFWNVNLPQRNTSTDHLLSAEGYSLAAPKPPHHGKHRHRFIYAMPGYIPPPSKHSKGHYGGKIPVSLPELEGQEWFKAIFDKVSIKIQAGSFKLATNKTVVFKLPCAKTVTNKAGHCTLIHECPTAIPLLTDLPTFLTYFCPLRKYAGICCDN